MALFGKGYDQGTLYFSQGRLTKPDDLKKRMFDKNDHGSVAGLQAAASTGRPVARATDWKVNPENELDRLKNRLQRR